MADPVLRQIKPMSFPDIAPGGADMPRPRFMEIDPKTLFVDETYQRSLARKGMDVIRRAIAKWDWRAFKPPIVVDAGGGRLHIIDGQHTAIAAASHPAIDTIPVQVVEASEVSQRASAFVSVNRDRVAITPIQLHYAMVAAGDDDALTIAQVCEKAGVRLLRNPPTGGVYNPGECLAISSIRALVSRRYAAGARRVLDACVAAKLTPISAAYIKAIEALLFEVEYAGQVTAEALALTIRDVGPEQLVREAAVFSQIHSLSEWRGLAGTLFRKTPKARNGRSAA